MSKELVDMIRREFELETGKKNGSIGLPNSYDYGISGGSLHLKIKNANMNMQKDPGAFDAWALAIKRWTSIKKIMLSWEKPASKHPNYQRFLYRVKKSTSIYDWLEVDKGFEHLLDDFSIKDSGKYVVNLPTEEASEEAKDTEARRELIFTRDNNQELAKIAGMDQEKLYRQLPVGVFKEKVSEGNAIFSGKAATIDLWGLNESEKELHLFELKAKNIASKSGNKPMGIYSQLFFYTMIQDDLIKGLFKSENPRNSNYRGFKYLTDYGYKNIKSIKSHFLVDEIHPLIDNELIYLINEAFKTKDKNIKFDIIKYELDESNKFRFKI